MRRCRHCWNWRNRRKNRLPHPRTLVIGVARAGSPATNSEGGLLEDVIEFDFGAPPHTLIFPGKLHFMEAEALIALADAPQEVMEMAE